MSNFTITKDNVRDAAHTVVETAKAVAITSTLYSAVGTVKVAQVTEHVATKVQTKALRLGEKASAWLQAQAR